MVISFVRLELVFLMLLSIVGGLRDVNPLNYILITSYLSIMTHNVIEKYFLTRINEIVIFYF